MEMVRTEKATRQNVPKGQMVPVKSSCLGKRGRFVHLKQIFEEWQSVARLDGILGALKMWKGRARAGIHLRASEASKDVHTECHYYLSGWSIAV